MISGSPSYKAAAVQAAPAFLDLDATIDKSIELIDQAAVAGARIIAFPETWLPGYPWWIWLGAPAWAIGRGFVQRYFDASPTADSPQAQRLRDAAKRAGIHVVMGVSERDGGSLYIAQWLIGPGGEWIARRRKLKPTHVERTVFGEGDGSDLAVHALDIGRVGALCCWEHLQPLTRYAMYSQHEQLHVAAWPSFSLYDGLAYALGPEVNNAASRMYAVEGSCYVLAPCAVVSQAMIDLLCDTPDKAALLHAGGGHAAIFGPDGRALAEPLAPNAEGLLLADVDLSMIAVAKAAADPTGHYSRPDVTRLWFNDRPTHPVVSPHATAADEFLLPPHDAPPARERPLEAASTTEHACDRKPSPAGVPTSSRSA